MRIRHGWSADANDWILLKKSLERLKWRKAQFRKEDLHLVLEEAVGVYIIHAPPPGRLHEQKTGFPEPTSVIYVGEGNIRSRLQKHLGHGPSDRMKLYRAILEPHCEINMSWTILESKSEAEQLETILIECFGPIINLKRGKSKPIQVSLKPHVSAASKSALA